MNGLQVRPAWRPVAARNPTRATSEPASAIGQVLRGFPPSSSRDPSSTAVTPGGTRALVSLGDRSDLLVLFFNWLQWTRNSDAGAGWDLIRSLQSADHSVRVVAASLLAKTRHAGIQRRHLRMAEKSWNRNPPKLEVFNKVYIMNNPYGLAMSENCSKCTLRQDRWFCGLSPDGLRNLSSVSHLSSYPGGALLFVEGQTPRGAYVLCSGKVKLSTTSREGKVLIVKMAEPGAVLGLSAVMAGEPYELTAETTMPCQVNFVERDALVKLIGRSSEIGLHSTQTLSREFQTAYRDIHDLILARSSQGKLARLLLSWTPTRERTNAAEVRIRSCATHEEMAQMIGSSRETVTRLLSDLKKKELIRLEGPILVIRDRIALEALAA